MIDKPKYSKFDMVRLKKDPSRSGVIWGEPIQSDDGWQYEIFFSSDDRRYVIEKDITTRNIEFAMIVEKRICRRYVNQQPQ